MVTMAISNAAVGTVNMTTIMDMATVVTKDATSTATAICDIVMAANTKALAAPNIIYFVYGGSCSHYGYYYYHGYDYLRHTSLRLSLL